MLNGRTSSPSLFFLAKQSKWEQYENNRVWFIFVGLIVFACDIRQRRYK